MGRSARERGFRAATRRSRRGRARLSATTQVDPLEPTVDARFAAGSRYVCGGCAPRGTHAARATFVAPPASSRRFAVSTRFPDIGPYAGPEEPVYAVAFTSDDLRPLVRGSMDGDPDLFESYLEAT